MVGARSGSPLVVGSGEHEHFLASDALALAGSTERIVYLEEGDVVAIRGESWRVLDREGHRVHRVVRTVRTNGRNAGLAPYRHFMQKEIFEQPRAVAETLEGLASIRPAVFGMAAEELLPKTDSVLILACGTSYHAGGATCSALSRKRARSY